MKLPPEAQEAFSSMKWMEVLNNINTKYNLNPKEIETLATETSMVLLGIISIGEYADILEKELDVEEEIKYNIFKEVDDNILKGLKDQLMDTFEKNASSPEDAGKIKISSSNILDPRFNNMPKDVQEVISKSNWKEDLYRISGKYKLSIIQMGSLEEVTVKVISDTIKPYQYESELASKIIISKEDMSNLVNDVNEQILIKIRNLLKKYWEENSVKNQVVSSKEEEIPLPPYADSSKEQVVSSKGGEIKKETPKVFEFSKQTENNINKIEVVRNIEIPKPIESAPKNIIFPIKKDDLKEIKKVEEPEKPVFETPVILKNIIAEKLKNPTVSNHTVSDYSAPKTTTNPAVSGDPYREQI